MGLLHQRLVQILDEVVRMFQADGEAQEVLWRGGPGALNGGPVLDQAFGPPEADRPGEQPHPTGHPQGRLTASPHLKRKQPSEGRH